MKTIYSIILEPYMGKQETIFSTDTYSQELLQREFDKAAINMNVGSTLEYMKETKKQFYPALLLVEMTVNGLVNITTDKRRKYRPKYTDN